MEFFLLFSLSAGGEFMLRILRSLLLAPLKCRFRQAEPDVWNRDALHASIWFPKWQFTKPEQDDHDGFPFFLHFFTSQNEGSRIPKNSVWIGWFFGMNPMVMPVHASSWFILQGARVFVEGENEICMGDVATLELRQGFATHWRIWTQHFLKLQT